MLRSLLCCVCVLAQSSVSRAENWPHWRGPAGNGTSATANPPTQWSSTENVKWKTAIPGRGSGSPVIWNDRVFVVSAARTDGKPNSGSPEELQFVVHCFNRADGTVLWSKIATTATPHQETHSTNGFASASPCTDGEHVYTHFGSRGLYCYTMDGDLKWKRDDFGAMNTRNGFGEGSSPTIDGNTIYVPWDHEGPSYLYALNKLTGETIWRADRDEPTCWATPLVIEHEGKKQVVMNGQTCARSYDAETGQELWRCGGQTERPAASAVYDGSLVFVTSGFRGAYMGAFQPSGRGNIEGTPSVVWSVDRDTPDIASPLLSGGRIYFYKGKGGQLTCLDAATGKPHYSAERIDGITSTYASPIASAGYVFLTGRSGTTVVIKDSPILSVVASNTVNETVDATPAVVDNELFIRGETHLFCISAK